MSETGIGSEVRASKTHKRPGWPQSYDKVLYSSFKQISMSTCWVGFGLYTVKGRAVDDHNKSKNWHEKLFLFIMFE